MTAPAEKTVLSLAKSYFHDKSLEISLLQGDGSDRQIFLIHPSENPGLKIIGIYHENLKENLDFIYITERMKQLSLPVPQILLVAESKNSYLLEYLGENNLGQ